jgi:hypothetical protein
MHSFHSRASRLAGLWSQMPAAWRRELKSREETSVGQGNKYASPKLPGTPMAFAWNLSRGGYVAYMYN